MKEKGEKEIDEKRILRKVTLKLFVVLFSWPVCTSMEKLILLLQLCWNLRKSYLGAGCQIVWNKHGNKVYARVLNFLVKVPTHTIWRINHQFVNVIVITDKVFAAHHKCAATFGRRYHSIAWVTSNKYRQTRPWKCSLMKIHLFYFGKKNFYYRMPSRNLN